MKFRGYQQCKQFIDKQLLSFTEILLHLPCFVTDDNVGEALSLVPAQWKDRFRAEVIDFDPSKEWRNTEHPFGLPPIEYVRGMSVLGRHLVAQRRTF